MRIIEFTGLLVLIYFEHFEFISQHKYSLPIAKASDKGEE